MTDRAFDSDLGRVAVVTGAGRGIGRAIAVELASLGMRLGLVARSRAELDSLATEIGGEAIACPVWRGWFYPGSG